MLIIDDETVAATQRTEQELRLEIALFLYSRQLLSFGQARKFAALDTVEFERLLFDRRVHNPYSPEDLDADLVALRQIKES